MILGAQELLWGKCQSRSRALLYMYNSTIQNDQNVHNWQKLYFSLSRMFSFRSDSTCSLSMEWSSNRQGTTSWDVTPALSEFGLKRPLEFIEIFFFRTEAFSYCSCSLWRVVPEQRAIWTRCFVNIAETRRWRRWQWRSVKMAIWRCISLPIQKYWTQGDWG